MVTQHDIARRTGLDVSTVNKILHHKPGSSFREDTVAKVFRAARALGYPVEALKHPHRRADGRRAVSLHCRLTFYRGGGETFDEGAAILSELSANGARVASLRMPKGSFPTEPFTVGIRPLGLDFELRGKLVRFYDDPDVSLGVALFPLAAREGPLLAKFIAGRWFAGLPMARKMPRSRIQRARPRKGQSVGGP